MLEKKALNDFFARVARENKGVDCEFGGINLRRKNLRKFYAGLFKLFLGVPDITTFYHGQKNIYPANIINCRQLIANA